MARSGFADRWADVSLRAKITGVTVFILFLGLIVAGVGTLSVLRPMLMQNQAETLKQMRNDPTRALADNANPQSLTRENVLYASTQYYVAVIDVDGKLLYDNYSNRTDTMAPDVPRLPLEWVMEHRQDLISMSNGDSVEWRGVAAPIMSNGAPSGTLLIAVSATSINQVIAQYVIVFTGFGIAVILLGAALTRLLVTATFMPLAEVEQTALEIARGDYSKRIMVASPNTEVGHLGESLNIMLDRLDGSIEEREHTITRMRRFVGDASHELRTPLVSVRGYAELYRMGALQDEDQVATAFERIEKESIRMTCLVEDLLALARLDERRPLKLTELDVNHLAHDAALDASAQAPGRVVTAVPSDQEPVVVADEHKVRQVMTNLIGNAVRHTPEHSPIEIVVGVVPAHEGESSRVSFEIVDHGEGVPEQIREKIFGRFWRADTSRNRETGGSGLGLAIVQSIVDAHGGTVRVCDTPGGGATFRVELPAGQGESVGGRVSDHDTGA